MQQAHLLLIALLVVALWVPHTRAYTNQDPVLRAHYSTVSGEQIAQVGRPVVLDASRSFHPRNGSLYYSFDYGDGEAGGTWDVRASTSSRLVHTYSSTGVKPARIMLCDSNNTATHGLLASGTACPVAVFHIIVRAVSGCYRFHIDVDDSAARVTSSGNTQTLVLPANRSSLAVRLRIVDPSSLRASEQVTTSFLRVGEFPTLDMDTSATSLRVSALTVVTTNASDPHWRATISTGEIASPIDILVRSNNIQVLGCVVADSMVSVSTLDSLRSWGSPLNDASTLASDALLPIDIHVAAHACTAASSVLSFSVPASSSAQRLGMVVAETETAFQQPPRLLNLLTGANHTVCDLSTAPNDPLCASLTLRRLHFLNNGLLLHTSAGLLLRPHGSSVTQTLATNLTALIVQQLSPWTDSSSSINATTALSIYFARYCVTSVYQSDEEFVYLAFGAPTGQAEQEGRGAHLVFSGTRSHDRWYRLHVPWTSLDLGHLETNHWFLGAARNYDLDLSVYLVTNGTDQAQVLLHEHASDNTTVGWQRGFRFPATFHPRGIVQSSRTAGLILAYGNHLWLSTSSGYNFRLLYILPEGSDELFDEVTTNRADDCFAASTTRGRVIHSCPGASGVAQVTMPTQPDGFDDVQVRSMRAIHYDDLGVLRLLEARFPRHSYAGVHLSRYPLGFQATPGATALHADWLRVTALSTEAAILAPTNSIRYDSERYALAAMPLSRTDMLAMAVMTHRSSVVSNGSLVTLDNDILTTQSGSLLVHGEQLSPNQRRLTQLAMAGGFYTTTTQDTDTNVDASTVTLSSRSSQPSLNMAVRSDAAISTLRLLADTLSESPAPESGRPVFGFGLDFGNRSASIGAQDAVGQLLRVRLRDPGSTSLCASLAQSTNRTCGWTAADVGKTIVANYGSFVLLRFVNASHMDVRTVLVPRSYAAVPAQQWALYDMRDYNDSAAVAWQQLRLLAAEASGAVWAVVDTGVPDVDFVWLQAHVGMVLEVPSTGWARVQHVANTTHAQLALVRSLGQPTVYAPGQWHLWNPEPGFDAYAWPLHSRQRVYSRREVTCDVIEFLELESTFQGVRVVYLDVGDVLQLTFAVAPESVEFLVSVTNPKLVRVTQGRVRATINGTSYQLLNLSITSFAESGTTSLIVSTLSPSLQCLNKNKVVRTVVVGCPPSKTIALSVPYSRDDFLNSDLTAADGTPVAETLPINYRPPSINGTAVPITKLIYHADPSKPRHNDIWSISKRTGQYGRCEGAANRAQCGCTDALRFSNLPRDTDCVDRVERVFYQNAYAPKFVIQQDGRQLPSTSLYRLEEINGRRDYCFNHTETLNCANDPAGQAAVVLDPTQFHGIRFEGEQLYHFRAVFVSESRCELDAYFKVYVYEPPLRLETLWILISVTSVLFAFILLGSYIYHYQTKPA